MKNRPLLFKFTCAQKVSFNFEITLKRSSNPISGKQFKEKISTVSTKLDRNRVTRLGECLPNWPIVYVGNCLKIFQKENKILGSFSPIADYLLILTKKSFRAIFFKNASGHPGLKVDTTLAILRLLKGVLKSVGYFSPLNNHLHNQFV
jgi:hypothetical protein